MKTKVLASVSGIPALRNGNHHISEPLSAPASAVVKDDLVSKERRTLLGVLTGLIGVGISSAIGITLGRFAVTPALAAASPPEWTDVGSIAEIPENTPTKHSVFISQDAGWGRFNSEQSVWVLKKGERLTVFSSTCPHLGCTISQAASGFGCVCHNSVWNADGERVSGPTPRGLDVLDHNIEDGVLKVKYQNFKQGIAEKVQVS